MRSTFLLIVLCGVLLAPPGARADSENYIGIFADNGYTACFLTETVFVTSAFYVVHVASPGSRGARFRLSDLPANWIPSDTSSPFGNVTGEPFGGMTVCFPSCRTGNVLLATVTGVPMGATPDCSFIEVLPHPDTGVVEAIDCGGAVVAVDSYHLVINDDPAVCPIIACFPPGPPPAGTATTESFCLPVATESRTWGAIKALYE